MFQCSECEAWSHTECYANYAGKEDEDLPARMFCHRCRKPKAVSKAGGAPGKQRAGAAAHATPRKAKKSKGSE